MNELEKAILEFAAVEKELQKAQEAELQARFDVQRARNELRNKRVALRQAEAAHRRQQTAAEKKSKLEAAHELADLQGCDPTTLKHLLESGTIRYEENRAWARGKTGE